VSKCWCEYCWSQENQDIGAFMRRRFHTCPECGNKRCPKATHHALLCTGSNEKGQPGSSYGVEIVVKDEVWPCERPEVGK